MDISIHFVEIEWNILAIVGRRTNLGKKKQEILAIPSHVFRTNLGKKKQDILTIPSHVFGKNSQCRAKGART
ncbi:Hypothetical predicted protein [Paramuricea clavata]|uniref:Uncharacterized protein n=1 Tax=Paramuricea clavata TaxID=317549 RepID=A0A6S7GKH4_PARCT|nr:Hypothetical predicted protein [Paramuricea clavata]